MSRKAVTCTREVPHPYTLTPVLASNCYLHHYYRDVQEARRQSEAVIRLAAEAEFPDLLAWSTIVLGWCQVQAEQVEDGIARVSNGLADRRAQGVETWRSHLQALLAEAYGKSGEAEKGIELVDDALAFVKKTGERFCEPELHRIRGELLLIRGGAEDIVKESFRQAIDVARRQQAKSWELRATTSLSRLLQKQGRKDEARRVLNEIYSWFTEGFDTADLKDAKALLDWLT